MHYIYKITNKINKKVYIGQTINFKKRMNQHKCFYKKKNVMLIDMAIRKYGVENFTFEIIETTKKQEIADELERYYIKKYDCKIKNNKGYNLLDGGRKQQGSWNRKPINMYSLDGKYIKTYECARIIEEEYPQYKEYRIKDTCVKKIKYKDKIFRYYVGNTNDIIVDKEILQNKHAKKVYQYDLDGNFIASYNSLKEASEKTNTYRPSISSCLNGTYQYANNYMWFYEKKEKPTFDKSRKNGNKGIIIFQKLNGKIINTFNSTIEAVEFLGLEKKKYKTLCKCIQYKRDFMGYQWEKQKKKSCQALEKGKV